MSKKLQTFLFFIICFTLFTSCANAATLEVGAGQAYTTLYQAIGASSSGDRIHLNAGTHYLTTNLQPKSGTTIYKYDFVFDTPTSFTLTRFDNGIKYKDYKWIKVK